MSIALTLALMLSVPQDKPLTVADLTYSETYACAALGVASGQWVTEQLNGAAPSADEQKLLTALAGLADAASGALDAAQAREGLNAAQASEAESAALADLGETDDETLFAMTDLCGTIFGVNFD